MKCRYFTLLLLMLPWPCLLGKDNPSQYNAYVNKAELAIVDQQQEQALRFYDSAFGYKTIPFAQDLYNASVCALKTNDIPKAFSLCRHIAAKGTGKAFFEKKPVFVPLCRYVKQWHKLLADADRIKDKYILSNREVKKIIDGLYSRDQEMHRRWSGSDYNAALESEMKALDDSVSKALLGIFKKYGYLSEDVIGVNIHADTILEYEPQFSVIMLHNYQGRIKTDTLFSPILREMLAAGKIKPEYYASIQDAGSNFIERPYYGTSELSNYKCTLYRQKLPKEVLRNIDIVRQRTGLSTLDDFLKKVVFNTDHANFEFLINARSTLIYSFANEESEKIFKEENDVIIPHIKGCKEYPTRCGPQ
jgi:hypothetical protein